MPPRTRRGAPRGGAAASRAAAPATPKQEDTPSQPFAHPAATVISSSESTPAPSIPPTSSAAAAASSSSIPAPTSASTSAPASASTTGRSFVFKPKVVRRTDDERKALAEQEEKKFNDRAAEEARLKRAASRGRGRGRGGRGRGRGDFGGGRDGLVRRTVAPDGPFSQVPGATGAPGGPGGFGGAGGRGGFRGSANGGGFAAGGSGGIGSGRGGGSTFSAVAEDHEYDPRLNTDTFMGRASGDYTDAKDELAETHAPSASASASAGKQKAANLLPMGIRREEHREPEVIVTTTAELEAADAAAAAAAAADVEDESDDELFFDNSAVDSAHAMNLDDDNEVWSRAIKTDGSVTILDANGESIVITDIDTLAEKQQEIAAAKAARAAGIKEEADDAAPSLDSLGVPPVGKPKKARKKKTVQLLPKDAEDLTVEQGLQAMLHDLAMDQPPQPDKERIVAEDAILGDGETPAPPAADGSDDQPKEQPRREGRLFLFQFPPVLPSLKPYDATDLTDAPDAAGTAHQSARGPVKQEPGADGDVLMLDGVAPIDLTGADPLSRERANLADIGHGGFLGTLNIRKSGRAELSWGGMTYEMMPGTDVNFLTTAVLLEDSDEKRKAGDAAAAAAATMVGNAFGMGPVGGKYNLVPVFSSETDWVVDPSELVIPEE
ncbi:rna polymerase iii rpc4 [Ophiostoma piceae UAMH 11346]|uniref:Rna polymerase iii rpc4 n=1 Tax=Ophiostoma piceae (strain UAMH 11346) TaxID=1262450 RepID=S3C522_OPHP1|nr:rna polymerase iii rpc4 [Ophiostoma piceae UAMH 11346]